MTCLHYRQVAGSAPVAYRRWHFLDAQGTTLADQRFGLQNALATSAAEAGENKIGDQCRESADRRKFIVRNAHLLIGQPGYGSGFGKSFNARKRFAFEEFKTRATAGGNMAHLVGETELMDCCRAVAAPDDCSS